MRWSRSKTTLIKPLSSKWWIKLQKGGWELFIGFNAQCLKHFVWKYISVFSLFFCSLLQYKLKLMGHLLKRAKKTLQQYFSSSKLPNCCFLKFEKKVSPFFPASFYHFFFSTFPIIFSLFNQNKIED